MSDKVMTKERDHPGFTLVEPFGFAHGKLPVVRKRETTCTAVELKITGYYGASPGIRELEIYGLEADKQDK